MSDWTPIQFVPLEWTAIRLHQIFKEWPLYSDEMTASIFLLHTNLRFLITFFFHLLVSFFVHTVGLSTSALVSHHFKYWLTMTETQKHTVSWTGKKWRRFIMVSCVSYHIVTLSPINYPRFSLITWTSWQNVPGRIHPPTRPCFLHAFWRTRAVHLAKTEIEHLFFMEKIERKWVCVCEMRQVCVCVCFCFVWLWCICLRSAMTDNRSEKQRHGD